MPSAFGQAVTKYHGSNQDGSDPPASLTTPARRVNAKRGCGRHGIASNGPTVRLRMRRPSPRERMKRIERVKLYPTASQGARLQAWLGVWRELYYGALEQRRD